MAPKLESYFQAPWASFLGEEHRLPFSRMGDRILAHAPSAGGSRKGEGSILGQLGDMLSGD